jgi:hypothetical protein
LLSGTNVEEKDVCTAPVSPPREPNSNPQEPRPDPPATVAPASESDPGKGLKIAGYVAGGAGLLAIGAGVFFGSEAQKISDDITNHTDTTIAWRDDIKDYEAKGQRYENMQVAFLISGGVLVLGGTALYLIGRSKKTNTETMALRPTASANTAGVVFSGSW